MCRARVLFAKTPPAKRTGEQMARARPEQHTATEIGREQDARWLAASEPGEPAGRLTMATKLRMSNHSISTATPISRLRSQAGYYPKTKPPDFNKPGGIMEGAALYPGFTTQKGGSARSTCRAVVICGPAIENGAAKSQGAGTQLPI